MGFLTTGFQVFAFMQFFEQISFKGFPKALLANIIGIILFVLFIMIALIIYGIATNTFAR